MKNDIQLCIEAYRRIKNLKLVGKELGIPWQTVYVHLKSANEPVMGDKLRYGSDRDKLASIAESVFKEIIPEATDRNKIKYQSSYDFDVLDYAVDVKASMPRQLNKKYQAKSWAFSFKKQNLLCDFICCFCFSENREIRHVLIVPSEFFKDLQTVSVSCDGYSKWLDYSVQKEDVEPFFRSLPQKLKSA